MKVENHRQYQSLITILTNITEVEIMHHTSANKLLALSVSITF